MKFTFERDAMIKEIAIAQEIISVKTASSIMSNVLLKAYNNTLSIKAGEQNSKVNFETEIPVNTIEEGSTTVYCDKFMGILNSLPEGEIEFNQPEEDSEQAISVIIKPVDKKIKFQIKSMSQDKYPDFATSTDSPYFDVPAKDIKEMISKTIFAVSDDETRLYMNGVFCEKQDDKLIMVATDSRRLSYIEKNFLSGVGDFPSAIIPTKILSTVLKHAPNEGNISVSIMEKMIFFKFGSYKFSSVLIEGQFPQYRRVIPENQAHFFQVNKEDLQNALKRVALMVVDRKVGRIYFNLSDGILRITSPQSDIGSADEEIPCEYAGDEHVIAINYRYIDEPLRIENNERVTFEFTEEMRAITMRPEPAADYFHIIMPMQRQ